MSKHWPTIKRVACAAYMALMWVAAVANAYRGEHFLALLFFMFIVVNLLDGGMQKIAEAIRTQRNYHIIGDANNITIPGGSVYSEHVTVTSRMEQ